MCPRKTSLENFVKITYANIRPGIFENLAIPGIFFVYFRSIKIVDFSQIRTRIVGIEGEHADHLTATMAHTSYLAASLFRQC